MIVYLCECYAVSKSSPYPPNTLVIQLTLLFIYSYRLPACLYDFSAPQNKSLIELNTQIFWCTIIIYSLHIWRGRPIEHDPGMGSYGFIDSGRICAVAYFNHYDAKCRGCGLE